MPGSDWSEHFHDRDDDVISEFLEEFRDARSVKETCPKCQGKGMVRDLDSSEVCPECGGNGIVSQDKARRIRHKRGI